MKLPYYTVEEMIKIIDEPNKTACFKVLEDNRELFEKVQGSTHNHQDWEGGYFDHVQEAMNWAIVYYEAHSLRRSLPFSLSDALLVVFLHDIEKPWKYEIGPDGELRHIESLKTKKAQHEFRAQKLKEYGIILSEDQQNGMKYVEGEFDDYSNKRRAMGPLAALCHQADIASARINYDHPQEDDTWGGIFRKNPNKIRTFSHPRNPDEKVRGRRLYYGDSFQTGDVYDSTTGKWETVFYSGLVPYGNHVIWIRPVK